MKAKDLCEKPFTIKRVIDLLKGLKEVRVDDKLLFGTCDYHEIEGCIEYLQTRKED